MHVWHTDIHIWHKDGRTRISLLPLSLILAGWLADNYPSHVFSAFWPIFSDSFQSGVLGWRFGSEWSVVSRESSYRRRPDTRGLGSSSGLERHLHAMDTRRENGLDEYLVIRTVKTGLFCYLFLYLHVKPIYEQWLYFLSIMEWIITGKAVMGNMTYVQLTVVSFRTVGYAFRNHKKWSWF